MVPVVSQMIQLHVCRSTEVGMYEHLLLQRSSDQEFLPNLWQPATEYIIDGETVSEAAKRELMEETGLSFEKMYALPLVGSFYKVKTDTLHLIPVFTAIIPQGARVQLSSENQAYGWFPYQEALDVLKIPGHKKACMYYQQLSWKRKTEVSLILG